MQAQLVATQQQSEESSSPVRITQALVERTGVPGHVWLRSGQEMLEAVLPFQSSSAQQILAADDDVNNGGTDSANSAQSMGLNV